MFNGLQNNFSETALILNHTSHFHTNSFYLVTCKYKVYLQVLNIKYDIQKRYPNLNHSVVQFVMNKLDRQQC